MKTKKSGIVEELKIKYQEPLARVQKSRRAYRAGCESPGSYVSDVRLFQKWACRVGQGWYGFSLGSVPRVWTDMLDDFLTWLEIQCPNFEIHQVKLKGRGLRLYLGTKTDFVIPDAKIRHEISQLEKLLAVPPPARQAVAWTLKEKKMGSSTFEMGNNV